jgi:EVE domain-containing protein
VVGIVKALSYAYPDPEDASGKYVAVDVAPVKRLPRPVSLAEIKADAVFKDFPRQPLARLIPRPPAPQAARIDAEDVGGLQPGELAAEGPQDNLLKLHRPLHCGRAERHEHLLGC